MGGIFDLLGAAGGSGGGNNPAAILGSLLGGGGGGLGSVISAFEQGGLGEQARSWVGTGQNLPISPAQLEGVLGSGPIADIAAKLGIDPGQAAGQLSAILPQIIDQLTPDGQIPTGGGLGGLGGGLGGLGDILGKLTR